MALDERIQTGAAIACLTRYQNMIEHEALHEHDIGYFVPNVLIHFDTEAVIALIAPRPVLFQNGDVDRGSPVDGIRAIESAARPAYPTLRQGNRIPKPHLPRPGPCVYPENVGEDFVLDG